MNKHEKEEITNKLNKQFGIKEIKGMIIKIGAEKLFLYQGDLTEKQIKELEKIIPVERTGIYFAKIVPKENKIRLSIEGTQLLKDQLSKNIFELDQARAVEWMSGKELNIATGQNDFLIIKYKDNFLGTGKATAEKISNYIPKNRRLKGK
ncbi:MAG TPA: hypothetical protein VJH65_03910 [Candidatus Nanoarchaeia archaeon]|nr:hypothetical protein [Candidatus Nanoarchaeia archaeon]